MPTYQPPDPPSRPKPPNPPQHASYPRGHARPREAPIHTPPGERFSEHPSPALRRALKDLAKASRGRPIRMRDPDLKEFANRFVENPLRKEFTEIANTHLVLYRRKLQHLVELDAPCVPPIPVHVSRPHVVVARVMTAYLEHQESRR